jgi:putative redox protein
MSFSGKSFHVDFLIIETRSNGGSATASADSAFLFTFLSEWKADKYKRFRRKSRLDGFPAVGRHLRWPPAPITGGGWPCASPLQYGQPLHAESTMECKVSWNGPSGMSFLAQTGSGHLVNMDGAPEGGGHNLAPRPMEMVLLGTGGCTAYDVVLILKKGRADVRGCECTLKAERAETEPKVFTKIHFHFTVTGKDLKPEAVERAVKLSHDKYCSASIMLAKTANITHSFEIIEA